MGILIYKLALFEFESSIHLKILYFLASLSINEIIACWRKIKDSQKKQAQGALSNSKPWEREFSWSRGCQDSSIGGKICLKYEEIVDQALTRSREPLYINPQPIGFR